MATSFTPSAMVHPWPRHIHPNTKMTHRGHLRPHFALSVLGLVLFFWGVSLQKKMWSWTKWRYQWYLWILFAYAYTYDTCLVIEGFVSLSSVNCWVYFNFFMFQNLFNLLWLDNSQVIKCCHFIFDMLQWCILKGTMCMGTICNTDGLKSHMQIVSI